MKLVIEGTEDYDTILYIPVEKDFKRKENGEDPNQFIKIVLVTNFEEEPHLTVSSVFLSSIGYEFYPLPKEIMENPENRVLDINRGDVVEIAFQIHHPSEAARIIRAILMDKGIEWASKIEI